MGNDKSGTVGALDGVRVLDFSMYIAGPYSTRLMADIGAEVVKIESPKGDLLRGAAPQRNKKSSYFGQLNCGKKSVVVDLKQPGGVALVLDLIASADVLVENFRPGVMDKFGLGYEQVVKYKPDLIYCSVSGYGQIGSGRGRAAYAPIVHAASGYDLAYMAYLESPEKPMQGANATADYLAATHAMGAISAALFRREKTGRGERLDIALLDVMHNMLAYELQEAQFPQQGRTIYKPLQTLDGFVVLAPNSSKNYRDLLNAIGHPEWRERFPLNTEDRAKNWDLLLKEVEGWTQTRSSQECEDIISAGGCPCSRYLTPLESIHQDVVRERDGIVEVDDGEGVFLVPNSPLHAQESEARIRPFVPDLGQHGREIAAEWAGFSNDEIDLLIKKGVLGAEI
ncbi:MAG: CoA transferase [Pseudomonadales bacterium]|nr:CoA transferase [Pseudomonadales bacterium]